MELCSILQLDIQPNALTRKLNINAGQLLNEYKIFYENSRKFKAENVDADRSYLNIDYCNVSIKKVYHELFDEVLERYNAKQTRADRKIANYYEKIRSSKQEKPFQELILYRLPQAASVDWTPMYHSNRLLSHRDLRAALVAIRNGRSGYFPKNNSLPPLWNGTKLSGRRKAYTKNTSLFWTIKSRSEQKKSNNWKIKS